MRTMDTEMMDTMIRMMNMIRMMLETTKHMEVEIMVMEVVEMMTGTMVVQVVPVEQEVMMEMMVMMTVRSLSMIASMGGESAPADTIIDGC